MLRLDANKPLGIGAMQDLTVPLPPSPAPVFLKIKRNRYGWWTWHSDTMKTVLQKPDSRRTHGITERNFRVDLKLLPDIIAHSFFR